MQCLSTIGFRFVDESKHPQSIGPIAVIIRGIGMESQRAGDELHRLFMMPLLMPNDSQQVHRIRVFGVVIKDLLIQLRCFLQLSVLMNLDRSIQLLWNRVCHYLFLFSR